MRNVLTSTEMKGLSPRLTQNDIFSYFLTLFLCTKLTTAIAASVAHSKYIPNPFQIHYSQYIPIGIKMLIKYLYWQQYNTSIIVNTSQ